MSTLPQDCRRRSRRQGILRDQEPNLRQRCLLATCVALWPQRSRTDHSQADSPAVGTRLMAPPLPLSFGRPTRVAASAQSAASRLADRSGVRACGASSSVSSILTGIVEWREYRVDLPTFGRVRVNIVQIIHQGDVFGPKFFLQFGDLL